MHQSGVILPNDLGRTIVGACKPEAPGSSVLLNLQNGKRRSSAPMKFAVGPMRPVLEHAVFAAFFDVTFSYAKREMDIHRVCRS
jgi:hypothetical protein